MYDRKRPLRWPVRINKPATLHQLRDCWSLSRQRSPSRTARASAVKFKLPVHVQSHRSTEGPSLRFPCTVFTGAPSGVTGKGARRLGTVLNQAVKKSSDPIATVHISKAYFPPSVRRQCPWNIISNHPNKTFASHDPFIVYRKFKENKKSQTTRPGKHWRG